MTSSSPVAPPSSGRLVRATVAAAAAAALVLATVVLPAEYGIDPTGLGRATGLYRAPEAASAPLPTSSVTDVASGAAAAGSLFTADGPFRSDEMTLTLAAGEGAEIKAEMRAGERLVYSWASSGGGVDVDMHGEAADKVGGDRSYKTGEFETAGHGALEAPMAGNHGWFWQNLNDTPVTITLKTAGFYRRLFRP